MEGTKKKIPVILRVWDKDTVTAPLGSDTFTIHEKSKYFEVRGPDITLGESYKDYLKHYIDFECYLKSVSDGWIKNKNLFLNAEDRKFVAKMIGSDGCITWDFALNHEYYTKICHTPKLFLSSEGRKMAAPGPVSNVQQLVPYKSAGAFSVDMQTTVPPPPPTKTNKHKHTSYNPAYQPVQNVIPASQQVNYPQNQYLNPNTNNTVLQFISQKNYSDIQQQFETNPSYPLKQPAGTYVAEIYDGYYMRSSQPIYKTRDGHFITNDAATFSSTAPQYGEISIKELGTY